MSHDVVISYSSIDKAVADAVCAKLEARGIRCWITPRDVVPGTDYAASIISAIDSSRAMVLIFSSNSNKSKYVIHEAERALHDEIPIVPFRIENVKPNLALQFYIGPQHWLDALTPPLEQHILKLGTAIENLLSITATTLPPPPPTKYCKKCGTQLGPGESSCKRCAESSIPPAYKGIRPRYSALIVDGIILAFIWLILVLVVYSFNNNADFGAVFLTAVPLYLMYFIASEGTFGTTIGKTALRIKVVKEDKSPISYKEAAIRAFMGIIDGLPIVVPGLVGCVAIARSNKKQRLGDITAHTIVVESDEK